MEGTTGRPRRRRRRRRRLRLLIPLAVIAGIVVAVILILRGDPAAAERQLVTNYVHAWAAGDYHRMYSLLDPASQQSISETRFADAYRHDAMTATLVSLTPVRVTNRRGEYVPVRISVGTRLFGTLRETRFSDGGSTGGSAICGSAGGSVTDAGGWAATATTAVAATLVLSVGAEAVCRSLSGC